MPVIRKDTKISRLHTDSARSLAVTRDHHVPFCGKSRPLEHGCVCIRIQRVRACVLLRKSHVHSTVENRDLVKRTVGVGRKRASKSCARFVRVYLRDPTACYLERGGRRDGARTASAAAAVRACAWVEGQEEETGDRRHDVEPRWRGWRVWERTRRRADGEKKKRKKKNENKNRPSGVRRAQVIHHYIPPRGHPRGRRNTRRAAVLHFRFRRAFFLARAISLLFLYVFFFLTLFLPRGRFVSSHPPPYTPLQRFRLPPAHAPMWAA